MLLSLYLSPYKATGAFRGGTRISYIGVGPGRDENVVINDLVAEIEG